MSIFDALDRADRRRRATDPPRSWPLRGRRPSAWSQRATCGSGTGLLDCGRALLLGGKVSSDLAVESDASRRNDASAALASVARSRVNCGPQPAL